jgi:hypothetical protein
MGHFFGEPENWFLACRSSDRIQRAETLSVSGIFWAPNDATRRPGRSPYEVRVLAILSRPGSRKKCAMVPADSTLSKTPYPIRGKNTPSPVARRLFHVCRSENSSSTGLLSVCHSMFTAPTPLRFRRRKLQYLSSTRSIGLLCLSASHLRPCGKSVRRVQGPSEDLFPLLPDSKAVTLVQVLFLFTIYSFLSANP